MRDRRRFYRVDDSVILNYRPFPEEQLENAISRLKMLSSQHKNLNDSLQNVESRLQFLFDEISEPLPEIAEALKLINRKLSIGLLGNKVDFDDSEKHAHQDEKFSATQEINLSASGLAFYSPSHFSNTETMEIEFVLFPEYYNVRAIGRVIACQEAEGSEARGETRFRVAIDFIFLKEEDKEAIIGHVLLKQGKDLKQQRQQESQNDVENHANMDEGVVKKSP